MCGGFGECELYAVFAARIVWLQCVESLVLVSDMSGKLEDLQTGLADKGEDWLRKELASLKLGPDIYVYTCPLYPILFPRTEVFPHSQCQFSPGRRPGGRCCRPRPTILPTTGANDCRGGTVLSFKMHRCF